MTKWRYDIQQTSNNKILHMSIIKHLYVFQKTHTSVDDIHNEEPDHPEA
jgi:hypothetical protein